MVVPMLVWQGWLSVISNQRLEIGKNRQKTIGFW